MRRSVSLVLASLTALPVWAQEAIAPEPETEQEQETVTIDDYTVLSRVLVFGDRAPSAPGSQTLLERVDTLATGTDRPADVLNRAAGVNIQMNSGQESLIAIRSPVLNAGAGQGSFLLMVNGVPTRASAFGNVNAAFELPLDLAMNVEVVRGPGSAKYGSNAVHGLVNAFLPEPGRDDTALTLSGSSLSRYTARATLTARQPPKTDASWLGASVQRDLGWRQSSGGDLTRLAATREIFGDQWEAFGFVSLGLLDQDTAGFIEGENAFADAGLARSNPNPEAFRQARWGLAAVHVSIQDAKGRDWRITPYLRGQDMEFSQHFLPFGGTEENDHVSAGVMVRVSENQEWGAWRAGADADMASGSLLEVQDRASFGPFPQGVHYDFTVDTRTLALWAEADVWLGRDVRVLAGLRGEVQGYDYTTRAPSGVNGRFLVVEDRSDAFTFLAPKLGLVWTPQALSDTGGEIYANAARGARAPQVSDLYRLQSLQERPAAGVETLDSLEIGIRGQVSAARLRYDVAAYSADKEGFFFRDADGLNVTDGRTRHRGVEAALVWNPARELSVSGNLAWSEQTYAFDRVVANASEAIRAGNRVDTAPEWLAGASLVWDPGGSWRGGLTLEHVGEYFTDAANTRTYPGHTLLHGFLGFSVGEALEVGIRVRNALGEAYADRADFAFGTDRYFPGEPRSVTLSLTRRFN